MDSNRVKLSLEHGESDYINAIYYDSYRQSKAFILTQTPLHVCLTSLYVSLTILTYTIHNTVHVLYITINECNVSVLSKNVLLLSTLNFTISVNRKIFFFSTGNFITISIHVYANKNKLTTYCIDTVDIAYYALDITDRL